MLIIFILCFLAIVNGQTRQTDSAAICLCDLRDKFCDLNCCCDQDCDANDRRVFSQCDSSDPNLDSKLCVRKNLIVRNNTEYHTEYLQNDLLCIYYDNNPQRSVLTEPDVVDTVEKFREYESSYGFHYNTTFNQQRSSSDEKLKDYYTVGQAVLSVYGTDVAYFLLPRPGVTSFCTYTSPAEFMINANFKCAESTSNLLEKCQSLWYMNAQKFYVDFGLLKNPKSAQNPNVPKNGPNETHLYFDMVSVSDVVQILPLDIEPEMANETDPSTPDFTHIKTMALPLWAAVENVCKNVPVRLELHDNQTADEVFPRSGNPGYILGLPVMAGQLLTNGSREAIQLVSDNTKWLTVITSDASGSCSQLRKPVLFGRNSHSGCLIELKADTNLNKCKQLRSDIINAITGPFRDRVGAYANASILSAIDWVPILKENVPQGDASSARAGTCSNMVLGMDIEILYANTGLASKPQAKVIGVKMVYRAPEEIHYQCTGVNCRTDGMNSSMKFVVSTTVTFIDVTIQPVALIAEIPTFDVKLPRDFFYPFSNSAQFKLSYALFALINFATFIVFF